MSKSKLDEFIDYLEAQVGNSLYVWGGQGETVKEVVRQWVKKKETSAANTDRVMRLLNRKMPKDIAFYDCSGLAVSWLLANGMLSYDTTADGLYHLCRPLTKQELKCGDFVFRVNSSGVAVHIGYVIDSGLQVIESQGRDVGVVKRPLAKGRWNRFGRPERIFRISNKPSSEDGLKEEASKEETSKNEISSKAEIGRVLKLTEKPRMSGEDVKQLQKALILFGIPLSGGADGVFGPETELAVHRAQQQLFEDAPKEWDGKAGKKTLEALGLNWR